MGILTDLFVDTGDLTYIFNQGRCFEQNRRYEDAIGRFREYLIKGNNLNGEEKAEAEKHIAACQSYLGKSEPREAIVPEVQKPAPQVEPPAETRPVVAAAPAGVAVQTAPADDGHSWSGLRIAGITVGSVGAAALITGVILNLKVNSMSNDLAKPENYSRSTDSTRQNYKTFGWISYGVGAACVASGTVLYYLGWSKNQNFASTVALVPTIESNMAGAALTGAF